MKRIAIFILILMSACACTKKAQVPKVVFDTDLGGDIDDVLALEMVLNYHKAGQIDLIGITLTRADTMAVQFVDGYLRFHGLGGSIPIGWVCEGQSTGKSYYLPPSLEATYDGKSLLPFEKGVETKVPEGWKLLRKLLASAPDNSVELLSVGRVTNFSRLMTSGPDEYSPLKGIDLVAAKVHCLHLMNGMFGEDPFPECNTVGDLPGSRIIYEKWPGELITSGWEIGNMIPYPHESIENDFGEPGSHPLPVAYSNWGQMPYDRPTWDLTTVYEALEPGQDIFSYSEPGTITLDEPGVTHFTPSPEGKHRYLILDGNKKQEARAALVKQVTNR